MEGNSAGTQAWEGERGRGRLATSPQRTECSPKRPPVTAPGHQKSRPEPVPTHVQP